MDEYLDINQIDKTKGSPFTLSFRLALLSSLFIILLLAAEFFLLSHYFFNQSISQTEESYDQISDRVAAKIAEMAPEQEGIDDKKLEGLLNEELSLSSIGAIVLKGSSGHLKQGYKKSSFTNKRQSIDNSTEVAALLDKGAKMLSRRLVVDNSPYSLDIYFYNDSLSRTVSLFISKNLLLISLFLLVVILANFFILKKLLFEPVFRLERTLFNFLKQAPDYDGNPKGKGLRRVVNTIEEAGSKLLESLGRDNLTGLPNRDSLLADIAVSTGPILFLINIDRFQQINDFYGNEVGDYILKETARRLKKSVITPLEGYEYTVYRLLSDEYAILLENRGGLFEELAGEIVSSVFKDINDKTYFYEEHNILVRITIGIARYQEGNIMTVLNKADMALKRAKNNKKQFLIYNETMAITKEYEKNLEWTFKLKSAVKENRIIPYFQPIMNNKTGKIEKYECLARLLDIDGKLVSPLHFLDIAKKNRLYSYITRIMVTKSFEIFKNTDYRFSINLSFFDIVNKDTKMYIIHMLNRYRNISQNIVFEILESEGIENYREIKEFINIVKAYGCKIAIDDFGTGYSNFAHIMKLDVDYLKLDASMIKNIDSDKNSYILTKNIINFANELGLETIAEYVHNDKILDIVKSLGVNYSQGYYLGTPMDAPHDYLENSLLTI